MNNEDKPPEEVCCANCGFCGTQEEVDAHHCSDIP